MLLWLKEKKVVCICWVVTETCLKTKQKRFYFDKCYDPILNSFSFQVAFDSITFLAKEGKQNAAE